MAIVPTSRSPATTWQRARWRSSVPDSSSPAVSTDGRQLAYIRYEQQTDQALLVFANGDGLEGRLVAETQPPFDLITFPRWSPDGSRLVFAASGGPGDEPAGGLGQTLFERLTGMSVAEAHGLPADLWLIGRDGQG